jgi:hypothetical protein
VVLSRLRPGGVVTERTDRNTQLFRQIAQQRVGHDLIAAQAETRMAQQCELHGRAEDIAGAALGMQQLQVVRRQRVMPGETRLIDGDAEQMGPLILG